MGCSFYTSDKETKIQRGQGTSLARSQHALLSPELTFGTCNKGTKHTFIVMGIPVVLLPQYMNGPKNSTSASDFDSCSCAKFLTAYLHET